MKAKLVKIGNSRGVRIPKPLIEQAGLAEEVELEMRGSEIVIRRSPRPRQGWADAARVLAERGDDQLLDEPTPTRFDEDDWQW